VSSYEGRDGFFGRVHLNESHLAILLEKLKSLDEPIGRKQILDVLVVARRRYIGQVESCTWGKDVVEIFGARLLETMQRRRAKVLGEAGVGRAIFGQLYGQVLGGKDSYLFLPQFAAIQIGLSRGGLLRIREVNQSRILFVKEYLNSEDIAVNAK
jgi:hypothetical protein